MKRYVTGLVALGFAIAAFAFTSKPKKISGKEVAGFSDPCSDASKKWFLMSLDCASQISFANLVGAQNYSMTTAQTVASNCTGSDCVCAILACPASNGTNPNISSGTSIYAALDAFYRLGATSVYIATKDDVIQGDSRRK